MTEKNEEVNPMSSSKHIETIYNIVSRKVDAKKARNYISNTLHYLIYDLQESGQEVTAEKIEAALKEEAEFFKSCEKEDVA